MGDRRPEYSLAARHWRVAGDLDCPAGILHDVQSKVNSNRRIHLFTLLGRTARITLPVDYDLLSVYSPYQG